MGEIYATELTVPWSQGLQINQNQIIALPKLINRDFPQIPPPSLKKMPAHVLVLFSFQFISLLLTIFKNADRKANARGNVWLYLGTRDARRDTER
jgi:hypothetical protein